MNRKTVRLAIAGIGNCTKSLVEGLYFYTDEKVAEEVGGLMHYNLGGYEPRDIQVVCGFDIDAKKSRQRHERSHP